MANIHDARDAGLGGKALFDEWRREFELTWMDIDPGELIIAAIAEQLAGMSDEQLEALEGLDPDGFKIITERIEKQAGGRTNATNIPNI